jgi:hypothetical protein
MLEEEISDKIRFDSMSSYPRSRGVYMSVQVDQPYVHDLDSFRRESRRVPIRVRPESIDW